MISNMYRILLVLVFSIFSHSWADNGLIRDTELQTRSAGGGSHSSGRPVAEGEELLTEIPSDIKDIEALKKYLKRFKEEKVVIKLGATWCEPCRLLHPEMEKLAESKKGQIKVLTLDVDNNPELANKLHPSSDPKRNHGAVPAIFEVEMGDTPEIQEVILGFFLPGKEPSNPESKTINKWLKEQR